MGKGQSWGGALGIGTESTYGTGVAASLWLPVNSETVRGRRGVHVPGGIYNSRVRQLGIPGLREAGGGFQMNGDAVHMGLPLKYLTGQVQSEQLQGSITAAPTLTPQAGGTLPDGAYRYKAAAVVLRADGTYWITNPSAESAQGTAGSGNNTIEVAFDVPDSEDLPDGCTYYGTAIYRTTAGGSPGSENLLILQPGSGATYTDNGGATLNNAVTPPSSTVYEHSFMPAAPSAGNNPLPGFSTTKLLDIATAQRFTGCRMNQVQISVGEGNNPVTLGWDLMAQDFTTLANPSPSFVTPAPFMNWQSQLFIDDVAVSRLEAFELTISNGLEPVPGLRGVPTVRDFYPGLREVSGSLTLGFEDQTNWEKLRDGTEFALSILLEGGLTQESGATITSPVTAKPWPYGALILVWKAKYTEAGGNLSGGERMTEQLPFVPYADPEEGCEVEIRLFNLTSSL